MEDDTIDRPVLRPVAETDVALFFAHEHDPVAVHMAAFTHQEPESQEAFLAHWRRILDDDTITARSIVLGDRVVGHIASFVRNGDLEVTYWIAREEWGKGIATRALELLLREVKERPMFARAAADNAASIRVLEKCGFVLCERDRCFANARGMEIDEVIMKLE